MQRYYRLMPDLDDWFAAAPVLRHPRLEHLGASAAGLRPFDVFKVGIFPRGRHVPNMML
jgi:hypothetical protein